MTNSRYYRVDPALHGCDRYFTRSRRYSEINWTRLDDVVDAFRERMDDWYLEPARTLAQNGHFAFAVMALNCLLIEALSQFEFDTYGRKAFKDFVRKRLPTYAGKLQSPIEHVDDATKGDTLENGADVIYHAFRCGILHRAHVAPYGLVDPDPQATEIQESKPGEHVDYSDPTMGGCPSITVNPLRLQRDLADVFHAYLDQLKDPDSIHDDLRKCFKSRFTTAFGVDLSSTV